MNNNHSQHELKYRKRWLSSLIEDAARVYPVVVITGARQVGKSTFLSNDPLISTWQYYTLDDFDVLALAQRDPDSIWEHADNIVIDEAQKAPAILNSIKKIVDASRRKKHFILSGSANLLLMRQVSESLAGRAVYFVLLPMALGEMLGNAPSGLLSSLLDGKFPKEQEYDIHVDLYSHLLHGHMPPLIDIKELNHAIQWWEGYVTTYLERDLRSISQVASLVDFRRFMEVLSLRNAQLVNQSEVARDSQLPQPTVHRYINLLETTHLIERLPAFVKSRTKRLIKSHKLFWMDPALACFLASYHDRDTLAASREIGALFETLVCHHLRILSRLLIPVARMYYWRTTQGEEVDFIIEHGRKIVAVEAKLTSRPHDADAENLRCFLKEYPSCSGGVLVYTGKTIRYLDRNIIAIPWTYLAV